MSLVETKAAAFRSWAAIGVATFAIFLVSLFATRTLATTVVRMNLPQVVAASETIVHGRVESVRSQWQGNRIFTEVSVSVARSLKGSSAPRVTFVQLGGRVETPVPLEMNVPGAPVHRVGDEAFYFLQSGGPGKTIIVGLFRGHVQVQHDDRGAYVNLDGSRKTPAEFEEEIRRLVAGQASPRPGSNQ